MRSLIPSTPFSLTESTNANSKPICWSSFLALAMMAKRSVLIDVGDLCGRRKKPPAGRKGRNGAEAKPAQRTGGRQAFAAGGAATGRSASATTDYPSSPILKGAYIRDGGQANFPGEYIQKFTAALPNTGWLITLVMSPESHTLPCSCAHLPVFAWRASTRSRGAAFRAALGRRGAARSKKPALQEACWPRRWWASTSRLSVSSQPMQPSVIDTP